MRLLENIGKNMVCSLIRDGAISIIQEKRDEYAENLERGTDEDGEPYTSGMISYYEGAIKALDEEIARSALVAGDTVEIKGLHGTVSAMDGTIALVQFANTEAVIPIRDLRKVEVSL